MLSVASQQHELVYMCQGLFGYHDWLLILGGVIIHVTRVIVVSSLLISGTAHAGYEVDGLKTTQNP